MFWREIEDKLKKLLFSFDVLWTKDEAINKPINQQDTQKKKRTGEAGPTQQRTAPHNATANP